MILPFSLRPGLLRSIIGAAAFGAAFSMVYRAFAQGEYYAIAAAFFLLQGFLFGGLRGMLIGGVFFVPAYFLLHFPIAQQSDPFGNILLTLAVYVGAVPTIYLAHAFVLKKILGVIISAAVIVPGYATLLIAPGFISTAIPLVYQRGPGVSVGASLVFAGFGLAFGYLWGIGAVSAGASAHEGPNYYAAVAELEQPKPRPVRQLREQVTKALPNILAHVQPMIRPIVITLGVITLVTGAIFFVALNPIVPVSRAQTYNTAASATQLTGEKLITFLVFGGVIIGAIVSLAALLAVGISVLNRNVNVAKKEQVVPANIKGTKLARLGNFALDWVRDILNGVTSVFRG
ncbi:MAG TPA: hypothetical protein PLD47_16620 [Aggregatilineales bacterium]|nr:hypothetical protein [Anaerolineales bacterium]HRE49350.1 hypothetical protein [Aggregatilineales bacterium]